MKKWLKIISITLLGLGCGIVHADPKHSDQILTKNTKASIKSHGKQLILNAKQKVAANGIYLLQNISNQALYLNHPAQQAGTASAGWMSQLNPGQWSALMVTQPNFNLSCQNNVANFQQSVVNCRKVLKVYYIKPTTLLPNPQGNYWLAENQSFNKLLKSMQIRGFP